MEFTLSGDTLTFGNAKVTEFTLLGDTLTFGNTKVREFTLLGDTLTFGNTKATEFTLSGDTLTFGKTKVTEFTLSGDSEALLLVSCSLTRSILRESEKWEEDLRSFRIRDHFVSLPFLLSSCSHIMQIMF